MSDIIPCNFCTLEHLKRHNEDLQLEPSKRELGGLEVLGVDGKFLAWFMALTKECVCGRRQSRPELRTADRPRRGPRRRNTTDRRGVEKRRDLAP